MGEIADMMLSGQMCQQCGEWLAGSEDDFGDVEGPGFPRLCPACAAAETRDAGKAKTQRRKKRK